MGKNLKTVVCECGERLNASTITGRLEPCEIHGFYGGNVTHFAQLRCLCGKEYRGYLEAENNSYTVIDMEETEKTNKRKKKK